MVAKKKQQAVAKVRPAIFDVPETKKVSAPVRRPRMAASSQYSGYSNILFTHSYNGEKNLGEVGPPRSYSLDYNILRMRSWQSLLESEIAQIIIKRSITWVIGKGLKLQAEPNRLVLQSEGITLDTNAFSELVEARFSMWARSTESDYARMKSLGRQTQEAYKNAIVGGDVLVILRYQNKRATVQLVDGQHVQNPPSMWGTDMYAPPLPNGNRVVHGVEISPTGEHVAYHVRKPGITLDTERVSAKSDGTGLVMARLIYGNEYRLDNTRGLPLVSAVLETAKKMERYKEATVGSAEERAKIAYTIEHEEGSDESNPLTRQMAVAAGYDPNNDLPKTADGEVLANRIAVSTNKQVFNMGMKQSLKALESKNELYFKDFFMVNTEMLCASVELPPDVGLSKYNSNFSASRAAIKDWEHTLMVKRSNFSEQFNQFIYEFWLAIEVLQFKIQAPGFLPAFFDNNFMALSAYFNARWVGANVPHIDPLKEVQAERLKLGPAGAALPLTTGEAATEALNGGESDANVEQFADEIKRAKTLGIEAAPAPETSKKPIGGSE